MSTSNPVPNDGSADDLIPVTVVGGYLGAGKTTLLNQLLAGDHGRRLAVLVNDFGAVNIDAELIAAHDGGTITLENGCICCSIADALGDALDAVLALDPLPDQIVIEASGAADPAKVAHYGQGWPGCRLDAVVVLADAVTIRRQADDDFVGELVVRQLRSADVVVVTKTDLVDVAVLDDVQAWIEARIGDRPTVFGASLGQIAPALLLDADLDPAATRPAPSADPGARFKSHVVDLPHPIPRARIESALEEWPAEVVRVKGIVELGLEPDQAQGAAVVQRVGRRWSIERWPPGRPVPARRCLVLIAVAGTVDLVELGAGLEDRPDP